MTPIAPTRLTGLRLPAPMPDFVADPGRVADFGHDVMATSAIFDDTGSFASGDARCPHWWGSAGDSYHRSVRLVGRDADALSLASRSIGGRVLDHAHTLAALAGRHDDLDGRFSRLVSSIADEITTTLGAGPIGAVTPFRDVDQEHSVLARMLADYERDRTAWITDLRTAEEEMSRAFRRVTTEAQITRYDGVRDPADDVSIPGRGTPPGDVRAWWRKLTRSQRLALLAASPEGLGGLDGLPAWVRDLANRTSLGRDIAELRAIPKDERTSREQNRYDNALATLRALREMQITDPATGEPVPVQLYLYDPDAFDQDGATAIAVGDLDSAANVAVTVPGFGTDMQSAADQATKAVNLYQASRFLDPNQTTATMFWIGYDAPDRLGHGDTTGDGDGLGIGADVVDDHLARAGGDRLAGLVDGITHMRADNPHLTVIGHSYGSTTAADGASVAPHGEIDDLILVGSPGAGPGHDHAADLGLPHDPTGAGGSHVWVGRNSGDPIAQIGDNGGFGPGQLYLGLGHDPASDDFGATRFEAEDPDRDAGGIAGLLADHTSYFDHNTESLANMGHIVDHDYGQVVTAPGVHDPAVPTPSQIPSGLEHLGGGLLHAGASPFDGDGTNGLADGLRQAKGGWDAVVGGPVDPESQRTPTSPRTH